MAASIVIKFAMMLVCYRYKSPGSRLLAIDARNDVVTAVVALTCGLIGTYYWKYMDPLGAVIVWYGLCDTFLLLLGIFSGCIAINWFRNAGEQIPLLSGKVADKDFVFRMLNIAVEHDPRILYASNLNTFTVIILN
jgi:divalent metal cation (Fe/Co/Zn/Cd) transporter